MGNLISSTGAGYLTESKRHQTKSSDTTIVTSSCHTYDKYLLVMVLPSGSTAEVGYCLVYRDLLTLVTAHLLAFSFLAGTATMTDDKGLRPVQM